MGRTVYIYLDMNKGKSLGKYSSPSPMDPMGIEPMFSNAGSVAWSFLEMEKRGWKLKKWTYTPLKVNDWNLKITQLKRNIIFQPHQTSIFGFHVYSFPQKTFSNWKKLVTFLISSLRWSHGGMARFCNVPYHQWIIFGYCIHTCPYEQWKKGPCLFRVYRR